MSPEGMSLEGTFTIHHLPLTISTLYSLISYLLSNPNQDSRVDLPKFFFYI